MKEAKEEHSTPLPSKDGLDVHSEEILDLMNEFMPSGSSRTNLSNDLMNNLLLIDDDLNESIIPDMSTKNDLSQLEVEGECV